MWNFFLLPSLSHCEYAASASRHTKAVLFGLEEKLKGIKINPV